MTQRLAPRVAGEGAHAPSPGPSAVGAGGRRACPSRAVPLSGGALGRWSSGLEGKGRGWSVGLSSEPPVTTVASAARAAQGRGQGAVGRRPGSLPAPARPGSACPGCGPRGPHSPPASSGGVPGTRAPPPASGAPPGRRGGRGRQPAPAPGRQTWLTHTWGTRSSGRRPEGCRSFPQRGVCRWRREHKYGAHHASPRPCLLQLSRLWGAGTPAARGQGESEAAGPPGSPGCLISPQPPEASAPAPPQPLGKGPPDVP